MNKRKLTVTARHIRTKRLSYDRGNIEKAYYDYKDVRKKLSIRYLARAYSVPETTLWNWIKWGVSVAICID